jgi:NADH-quinone oxidoreductase subunit L
MFRLIYMTFYGTSRVDHEVLHHVHESPPIMTVPLIILAVLSVVGGLILGVPPEHGWIHRFLGTVISHGPIHAANGVAEAAATGAVHGAAEGGFHALDALLMIISVLVGVLGWGLAWYLYTVRTDLPGRLAARYHDVYEVLLNKYWVDELYDYVFVRGGKALSTYLWRFDERVVDGAVNGAGEVALQTSMSSSRFDLYTIDGSVNGLSVVIKLWSRVMRLLQTGFVQNYLLAMVLGLFVIVTAYILF